MQYTRSISLRVIVNALTHLYYIAVFCNAIITLSSGKFKRYCYDKCGRVVKTRVSGGKIRQDSKIENQKDLNFKQVDVIKSS